MIIRYKYTVCFKFRKVESQIKKKNKINKNSRRMTKGRISYYLMVQMRYWEPFQSDVSDLEM
jgi:hypothetical protein